MRRASSTPRAIGGLSLRQVLVLLRFARRCDLGSFLHFHSEFRTLFRISPEPRSCHMSTYLCVAVAAARAKKVGPALGPHRICIWGQDLASGVCLVLRNSCEFVCLVCARCRAAEAEATEAAEPKGAVEARSTLEEQHHHLASSYIYE